MISNAKTLLLATLLLAPSAGLLFSSSDVAAQGSEHNPQAVFDARLKALLAEKDPGKQLALYSKLPGYAGMPIAHARARLEELISITDNPLIEYRALRWLHSIDIEGKDWSDGVGGMDGPLSKEGCLTDFQIVGPFANDSMNGFFEALPPERGESGPYEGKHSAEVDWRPLPPFVDRCTLNLDMALYKNRDSTVLLSSRLDSPKARKAQLLLAASGSYKVWLNGEPVAIRKEDQGFFVDSDAWSLPLKEGKNTLVIKLASSEGNKLDLVARLTDKNFKPLALVQKDGDKGAKKSGAITTSGAWSAQKLGSFEGVTLTQTEGGLAAHAERLSASDDHHTALLGALLWKKTQPRNAATPWRDVADRLDAARLKGELHDFSAQEMIWLSSLFEERWKRLEVREDARMMYPDHPQLLLLIGRTYARLGVVQKKFDAGEIYAQLVKNYPDFTPALLEYVDHLEDMDMHQRAYDLLLSSKTPERMQQANYVRQVISAMSELERDEDAKKLLESMYATHSDYFGETRRRVDELIETQKINEALELVRAERARYPWSIKWLMQEVSLLRINNELDRALALLDERLALSPLHTGILQRQAELLLLQDKEDLALAKLRAVKVIEPQNQFVEDYIAHLEPDTTRYQAPWIIDNVRELAEQMPAGPFHASTIVEQKIIRVQENGLSQHVVQHVSRVNTTEGIDDAATHRVYYSTNDEKVDVLSVRVLKPDGSVTEDYDRWSSANSRKASTTYNDGGSVTLRANSVEVGDLVEFRYRLRNTSSRNFRGDYFGDTELFQERTPIGTYRYTVLYPEKIGPLYFRAPATAHERTDDVQPDGSALEPGYKSASFLVRDVPEVETERNQPGYAEVYDHIIVSNKETLDELGKWWWNLVEEQLIVDDNIRKKVRELTDGLTSEDEKVRAIHNYVVQNTRYLHVGLGIHGWKPYRTTTCFRNRYGDCKDKAALLKVMLEEAGVPANLVLVRTRHLGEVGSYPASMNVFNHAIAYVPSMDLFLDGTAEYNGTRELTTMDQGAQALIIEDGGKARWATMPVDEPSVNVYKQTITMDLTGDTPRATLTIVATGSHAVSMRSSLEDPDRRDEVIARQIAATYPGATLDKATYSDLKELEQPVELKLEVSGIKLVQGTDQNPFIYPLATSKDLLGAYASTSTRDQDLIIRVPYTQETTIKYVLPKSKAFKSVPQGKTMKSPFGSLQIEYAEQGNELVVRATYSIDTHRVKVEDYEEFRSFMREVTGTLNEAIELKE